MLRKLFISVVLVIGANALGFAQSGALKGKVIDSQSKEPIPFANIVLETGGRQFTGATSDFDGNYTIKPLPPGKYDVKASYVGYKPLQINGVVANSDKITFLDISLDATVVNIDVFEVKDYRVPLISKDETSSGQTVTSEEIAKMPGRTANSVVATVGGVIATDGGNSVRGARAEGTVTYIDGVRVRGSGNVPAQAIEQVSVVTGGYPAQYGDATGGIINITTKGPSREWGGGVEILTSQFIDKYGYNLIGFSLQGPILMGKDKKKNSSLLGFFISGEAKSIKDENPSAIGIWKVKDSILNAIQTEPLRPSGTSTYATWYNTEFITRDDLEKIKARNNNGQKGINITSKIDVRTSATTNLTIGGSIDYTKWQAYQYAYTLFNNDNNPFVTDNTWRVFGRFTQRFNTSDTAKKKAVIKNVYYSIQADYSQFSRVVEDEDFKDNLFKYGYVGKFTTNRIRSYSQGYEQDSTSGMWAHLHNGFADTLVEFEPGTSNPVLSNYTSQFYDIFPSTSFLFNNLTNIQLGGGLLNGDLPANAYSIWTNVGVPYNSYNRTNQTQMTFNATGSADINNHAVSVGFSYEQRVDRGFGYSPVGIWGLMRQLTNKHILELDKNNPHQVVDVNGVFQDTIWYDRLYDAGSQAYFDIQLREHLGIEKNSLEYIDIDSYSPDEFSIDMFSADELLNSGKSYVNYYGYDHLGNMLNNKPSFDDFFTKVDENGNYTREIGAYEPIYMAGYIQDKFAFDDLVFNVGVRFDRFDANQKVLKDKYLLFNAKTAGEVGQLDGVEVTHPSNIGTDYVVYVDDKLNPKNVVGYRNEGTWYNSQGIEVTDPYSTMYPNGVTIPYLVDPTNSVLSSSAFEDYKPQITMMPRIAFSFPISDKALFSAHYAELSKRPSGGIRLDPTDYFYIAENASSVLNNPNLKPERTIDYELGFQQVLSKTSSLKISSYYREQRNLVQVFRVTGAYPISYISYDNIDFGTVKGFTVAYDLRHTGNVWMKASYTLQFADGTGSSSTSGLSLVSSDQPNLRTMTPLDFDRRHMIQMVVDYRYGEGKEYNGPKLTKKIKGTDKVKTIELLANTGANFTMSAGSGTPYSKQSNVTSEATGVGKPILKGMINGARLPWEFRIDARVDRDILLTWGGKKEGSKKKEAYLNVYFQILNLLNTRNINGVYRATGNPNDDGYLAAPEYQTSINSQNSPQAFRDLYVAYANSPYNYSTPRIVRFGVSLGF
ncbi:MAG: carboxypeptidase regulatory-like domain-containing protein [Bacteroidota bacterium]